jgi:Tfp pilus assembly protein PilF
MNAVRLAIAAVIALVIAGCVTSPPASKAQSLSDQAYSEIQHKNYNKAGKLLEESLALDKTNAFAWLNLGVVNQNQGHYAKARECYLKVVDYAWDEKGSNKKVNGRSLITMARNNLEALPDVAEEESTKKDSGK